MNIYKVWRDEPVGWDEYDAKVVIAKDEQDAIKVSMKGSYGDQNEIHVWWDNKENLIVQKYGKSLVNNRQVILESFNAG